jgi:type IV secretory pathway VirB9-like protein
MRAVVCGMVSVLWLTVNAAQPPKCGTAAGMEASSVCTLVYSNNRNVYQLPEFYPGYQMHIYFEKDERVLRYALQMGSKGTRDNPMWEVMTKPIINGEAPDLLEGANRLGIKMTAPFGVNPQTNLVITTVKGSSEREYVFLLRARHDNKQNVMDEAPKRAVHVVHFLYPSSELAATDQKEVRGTKAARGCTEIRQKYPRAYFGYNAQGNASPFPLCFWDDGQNSYMLLADQSDVPSVWSIDVNGLPSLRTLTFRPPIVHIVGVYKHVVVNFDGAAVGFERIGDLPLTVTYR